MIDGFAPGFRVKILDSVLDNDAAGVDAASLLIPEPGAIGIVSPIEGPDGMVAVRFNAAKLGVTVPKNPTLDERTLTLFMDPEHLFVVPRYVDTRGHQAQPLGRRKPIAAHETPRWFDDAIRDAERKKVYGYSFGMDRNACRHCGERYTFEAEGDTLVASTECTEIGGLKPFRLLLNVPSGEIVFANDLRDLVVAEEPIGTDVNSLRGQRDESREYERAGMLFVCVGNSCPSVYREEDGTFTIASRYVDEDDDTISDEEFERLEKELDATRLGWICTDLWWVSAMDRALFDERCKIEDLDPAAQRDFVVKVEPGVYAFEVDPFARDEYGQETIYARFFRVDEPAPAITDGIEPPAACLEESYLWRRMMATFEVYGGMLYGYDPLRWFESKFFGSASSFVRGHLRDRRRMSDTPFWRLNHHDVLNSHFKTYKPAYVDLAAVPTFDTMPRMMRGDSWNFPPAISSAPLNVDPYWLAAGLMFCKTAIERPECFERSDKRYEKQRMVQVQITMKTLAVLGEIAQKRGLLESGELAPIFEELLAATRGPRPTPPKKDLTFEGIDILA